MYNQDLKQQFIRDYTSNINTAKSVEVLFNHVGKYENEIGKDICQMEKHEIDSFIDHVIGIKETTQYSEISILRNYARWYIKQMGIEDCLSVALIQYKPNGVEKIRSRMVASPLHLQNYLNKVFDKESDLTIDNLYRCFCWIAFSGIPEEYACGIKKSDIDLSTLTISTNGLYAPIYRESMQAFKNAVELNYFKYKHPLYAEVIDRERIQSDFLFSGIKSINGLSELRTILNKKSASARKIGLISEQLSYNRIRLSGLFYEINNQEIAGIPVDFKQFAESEAQGKEFKTDRKYKINRLAKMYEVDYNKWKVAFYK